MNKSLLTVMAVSLAAIPVMAADFISYRSVYDKAGGSSLLPTVADVTYANAPERESGMENSMEFSVAGEPYDALAFGNLPIGSTIYEAIQFTSSDADLFAGNAITGINIYSGFYSNGGLNKISDVTVFIADAKDKIFTAPLYTQKGKLSKTPFELNRIELNEPFEIEEGKELFIGYCFKTVTSKDYYVVIDGDGTASSEPSLAGYVDGNQISWAPLDGYGNLCISATISGEHLPKDAIVPTALTMPSAVHPGKPFDAVLTVRNAAITDVTSLAVEYILGEEEPETIVFALDKPLAYDESISLFLSNLSYDRPGYSGMSVNVVKVNGVENAATATEASASFACFNAEDGLPKMHLVEEFTGTWCGWCPRGIVMMDYLKENYPDKFARVAVHSNDVMQTPSCLAVIGQLGVPGYPYMIVDRTYGDDPLNIRMLDEIANGEDLTVLGISSLGGSVAEDGVLTIDSSVRFVFDTDNSDGRFRLAYYLTEDSMGPYLQSNNYSGGQNGYCGGWENLGAEVPTVYDDVARLYIGNMTGFSNSIPAEITGGQEYSFTTTASTATVMSDSFYITAMIIDNTTGEIANVSQIHVDKSAGVTGIAQESAVAQTYYDLSGRVVENPSNGIYILRTIYADGRVKSSKVVIK